MGVFEPVRIDVAKPSDAVIGALNGGMGNARLYVIISFQAGFIKAARDLQQTLAELGVQRLVSAALGVCAAFAALQYCSIARMEMSK